MAELGHRGLRELIEGFGGCDEYFSEMISAAALLDGGPFEKWYIDNGPRPDKLVFQLVGADAGRIAGAAALLDGLECAGIDLNMGCCAPPIRRAGGGIAWMASADRAGALVGAVRRATKKRLSVKLRIGFSDDFGHLAGFCRRLEAEGADFITLHPRTARQKLKRLARWDYVGALRGELRIPVAGNGDVGSAEDLLRRAAGPCDAVMAGRAAVRRPWIFAQARSLQACGLQAQSARANALAAAGLAGALPAGGAPGAAAPGQAEAQGLQALPGEAPMPGAPWPEAAAPAPAETPELTEETGLRFLELLARWQPPEFHISRARRFFGYFCDGLKWGNYMKNLLSREETLAGMERAWRGHFAEGREQP